MDKELLYRFFNGTATESERICIREWAEAAPENMRELLNERKLYTTIILTGEKESFESHKKIDWYKRIDFIHIGRYAAVFICAVLLTWLVSSRMNTVGSSVLQIDVPLGQYMNLTLADGTTVYLNSGTTFRYPTAFTNKVRQVEIDGEGFFQVTHQKKDIPFVVKTFKGDVRVLGTKFNVEAYTERDRFVTSLIDGKVEVVTEVGSLVLNPNEKAMLVDGRLEKESLLGCGSYSWTGGIIDFNNIRFGDLMSEFEKIYGVRIIIENPELEDNFCLGKFRRIDGLYYALQVLQVDIPFEFRQDFETQTFYIN